MSATRFDQARLFPLSEGHERLMLMLCQQIKPDMLDEIAACDYGMDQVAHRAALEKIRVRDVTMDRPLVQMAWVPKEVLELFRWSEYGDDRSNRRPRTEAEFHLMRAFCCAALLEAYTRPENHERFEGTNSIVIQMLESLEVLGADSETHTPAFLAWMLTKIPSHEDERAFYIVALVWALMRNGEAKSNGSLLGDLVDWAFDEEATVRAFWNGGVGQHPGRWLIGTTHFDLRWKKWETMGRRLGEQALGVKDASLRSKLQDLAQRLSGD